MSKTMHAAPVSRSLFWKVPDILRSLLGRIKRLAGTENVWIGDTLIIGNVGEFLVHGFSYIGPGGEVRWQTVSGLDVSGACERGMHAYWVTGDEFRYIKGRPWKKKYKGNFMGAIATNVDPAERTAILETIEKMGKPDDTCSFESP